MTAASSTAHWLADCAADLVSVDVFRVNGEPFTSLRRRHLISGTVMRFLRTCSKTHVSGLSKSTRQTSQHSGLVSVTGLKQVCTEMNKVDCCTNDYKRERYGEFFGHVGTRFFLVNLHVRFSVRPPSCQSFSPLPCSSHGSQASDSTRHRRKATALRYRFLISFRIGRLFFM